MTIRSCLFATYRVFDKLHLPWHRNAQQYKAQTAHWYVSSGFSLDQDVHSLLVYSAQSLLLRRPWGCHREKYSISYHPQYSKHNCNTYRFQSRRWNLNVLLANVPRRRDSSTIRDTTTGLYPERELFTPKYRLVFRDIHRVHQCHSDLL